MAPASSTRATTAKYRSRGAVVVGLSADQEGVTRLSDIKRFVDEFSINYPIGLMNVETFERILEVTGADAYGFTIPTTLVLGRRGELLRIYSGYYHGQEQEIENLIADIIESEEKTEKKD